MSAARKPKNPPIWERMGFATRNQYRNAQVAKITNPNTGTGFTSYRQYRDYRAKELGRPRDTALERERSDIRARAQGFTSARDRQIKNRMRRAALSVSPSETLAKYGLTMTQFNRMRSANRKYQYHGAYSAANTYDLVMDKDLKNFSDERVGYIVSFYHAVVDKKTNYWSLFDKKTKQRRKEFGMPVSNEWQRKYLVDYAKLMSVSEYEARYGHFAGR